MLDELQVSNLGLIAEASVEPGAGLVVFSGETGAGKTLLLGALRLLTGEPARRDRVGPAAAEAAVSGRFLLPAGDELIVRRKIAAGGRSRAYIDDTMVAAASLAKRTRGIVELVAQHDHLVIASSAGLRGIIDGAMGVTGRKALEAYTTAWRRLEGAREKSAALGGDQRALQRERDMVRFQADEIEHAAFRPGEDDDLAAEAERLRNHAVLMEGLAAAATGIGSGSVAEEAWERGAGELHRVAKLDPQLEPLAEQADHLLKTASGLAREIADAAGAQIHDPGRLDEVERRLALLGDLRRKYGDRLADVLAFGAEAASRADELERLLGSADVIERELTAAAAAVDASAAVLSKQRRKRAERIARDMMSHLRALGFSAPVVDFGFEEAVPTALGADRIVMMFASDVALDPAPAHRVASGGELSRLVLSLRLSAGVEDSSVIAFDEIDAGIGGATALAMGRKLADLATGRQVLCVTHLPQVAAFADRHFVVRRDRDTAIVEAVADEARLEELSRMLAGMPESERGIAHARELLEAAGGVT
jgi:DNA repair protein RecN (Recombination protein N)